MLERFLMWLGFGLCHQLPERSFFGGGVQVPVCARDTGIYIGLVISLAVLALIERGRRPDELPRWPVLALGVAFVGAMGLDGVTQLLGLRESTNDLRLITGLMTGYAISLGLVPVFNMQVWKTSQPRHLLERPRSVLAWLATLPVAFAVVRWVLPFLGVGFPVLVALAVLGAFTSVNLAVVCLFPPFERRSERLRDAWLPMLIALALTLGELWLTGMLKPALISAAGGV
ncbi:MAG: hypothetical protein Kow0056_16980 [Coriobacteriia bacterium]